MRLSRNIRKLSENQKGVSLVEVIVALTVLGLISVPISMTFLNSTFTAKLTKEQIELTAITRMVKENVAESVKRGCDVFGAGNESKKVRDISASSINDLYDVKIEDRDGNQYPNFMFDVERSSPDPYPDVYRFLVTIKERNNNGVFQKIRQFRMEVNVLY